MWLHRELEALAEQLVTSQQAVINQAYIRRSISTSYYSVFHLINYELEQKLVGEGLGEKTLRSAVSRSIDHRQLKDLCDNFRKSTPRGDVLKQLWGEYAIKANSFIAYFASSVIELQEARHTADYDLTNKLTREDALDAYVSCRTAHIVWDTIDTNHPKHKHLFLTLLPLWPTLSKR